MLSDEFDPIAFSGWHQALLQKEMGLHYRSGPAMEASGEDSLATAPDHRGLIPQCDCPAHLLPTSPAHPQGSWKAALSLLCPASRAVPTEAVVALCLYKSLRAPSLTSQPVLSTG